MPVTDHIDNAVRSVTFNPVASAGPFSLPFPLYEADSAAELKSDFLITLAGVAQSAYSVSGTFVDSVALDGAVTFTAPITGALIIYSRRRPRTSVDVSNGAAITSEELRAILNGLIASTRDVYDWMARIEAGTVLPAGTFVNKAGDTMTGFLDLVADPTTALKAATKQYVDGKLPSTTKGDLIGHTGVVSARISVGLDGTVLRADSTDTEGIVWTRNKGTLQTLTDAANIVWDMSLGDDAKVTLGGNRTLSAPANEVVGQVGYLDIIQDATGSRTLTWNAAYKFPNGNDQKPCPDIGSTTRYQYQVRAADDVIIRKMWVSARDSIGFFKEYDLGVLTLSSAMVQAHGLGRYPALVQAYLENTTTNLNYAVGRRIDLNSVTDSNSGDRTPTLSFNITDVTVYVPSGNPVITNATTFVQATLTAANWKLIIRVYD